MVYDAHGSKVQKKEVVLTELSKEQNEAFARLLEEGDERMLFHFLFALEAPLSQEQEEEVLEALRPWPVKVAKQKLKQGDKGHLAMLLKLFARQRLIRLSPPPQGMQAFFTLQASWTTEDKRYQFKFREVGANMYFDIWLERSPSHREKTGKVLSVVAVGHVKRFVYGPWMNAFLPGSFVE